MSGALRAALKSVEPTAEERRLGAYETPPALVRFVVRSVHELLRERFGLAAGLADRAVRVLDPAAGPLNFLLEAWRVAVAEHERGGGQDLAALARHHLVPHFASYELRAEAHRAGLAAAARFFRRLGLPPGTADPGPWLHADALACPRPAAGEREGEPVLVVLGNPPWCGRSAARGEWITRLLHGYRRPDGSEDEGYFRVDGEPLGERNPKWLNDDYVRFLRLAQWRIERAGQGLVALVLNHNALDAPTFRGLRRSLLSTFEEVHALDLHGNRRRRERGPDGGEDENLFAGVAQGTAVLLLVKRPGLPRRVLRADLHGTRRAKLRVLEAGHVGTTAWQEVWASAPAFLFLPTDASLEQEYGQNFALPEIFPRHGVGVTTGEDAHFTALSRRELVERFGESRRLAPFLARPFDVRYLLYDPRRLARPRVALMKPMLSGDNLGLVACRQCREEPGAFVTRWMPGHKAFSAHDGSSLFPLYLASNPRHQLPNLSPALCLHLAGLYGEVPSPEAVLGYVYAVLWSPAYRARFRELLRRDFPRVPFPRGGQLFEHLSRLGDELVALHLLTDPRLRRPAVRLVGDRRLPLGKELRFAGLAPEVWPEVWTTQIGGYPVLRSWLRARAGRALSAQEVLAFRRAAAALALTCDVQRRIDEVWRSSEITALRAA